MAWLTTFEPESHGGVQEDQFNYSSIGAGDGVEILYSSPVYITQIVVDWVTASVLTLSVELPSGATYTVQTTSSVQIFTLNTRTENYIYWTQLPVGSRLRFAFSGAITNFKVSIISNSI